MTLYILQYFSYGDSIFDTCCVVIISVCILGLLFYIFFMRKDDSERKKTVIVEKPDQQRLKPDRLCPNCRRVIPFDANICPYCKRDFEK